MILIISNEFDQSTNDVIKYLYKKKQKYIRLGIKQFISSIRIEFVNEISIKFIVSNKIIDLKEITSFWYRKHFIELLPQVGFHLEESEQVLNFQHAKEYFTKKDINSLRDFLIFELSKKRHLGNLYEQDGNKLISFSIALDCGLNIPRTYISSNVKYLYKIFKTEKDLIVKPVEDAFGYINKNISISAPYHIATEKIFQNTYDEVLPSCLQQYLEKKIELRIFYLNGKLWSLAIFSQFDDNTKIDFRNYNKEKPNRMVPYVLPKSIASKLRKFMKRMQLNTGSIDMILTRNNKYIFLEVNPVGQYGMIGLQCNYNLDEKIANFLLK